MYNNNRLNRLPRIYHLGLSAASYSSLHIQARVVPATPGDYLNETPLAPAAPPDQADLPEVAPEQDAGPEVAPEKPDDAGKFPVISSLAALGLVAFVLRAVLAGEHSAYMDESTFVLTGRYLLEKQAVYAGALNWTYGSYLWSVLAGLADMAGGLLAVRWLNAFFGAVMSVSTALLAYRLAPAELNRHRRWTVGLVSGTIMALMPTALGVGRFGTYDGLAGAAFMLGVALLVPATRSPSRRWQLLGGAALLFTAFLAKYVVAIFFPFVCLYLLFAPRSRAGFWRNLLWCVAPLSVACAVYFVLFQAELLNLLTFSVSYGDLKSDNPFRQYGWERPELWGLALAAAAGWRYARGHARLITTGGLAVIAIFQAVARPDFDFWKHSIYVIFFLAPLAGLLTASLLTRLFVRAEAGAAGTVPGWRRRSVLAGLAGIILTGLVGYSLYQSTQLVTFYPNFNPALGVIQAQTQDAKWVLTDDSVLRYYLYPRISTDRVTDPFHINYKGLQGMAAYRQAITDRHFDTIVLDGGIGPQGKLIRAELGSLIEQNYRRVYSFNGRNRVQIEIFKPLQGTVEATPDLSGQAETNWPRTITFANDVQKWGGQPEKASLEPGLQVQTSRAQTWQDRPVLQFNVTPDVSIVGVKQTAPVRQIKARIYVVARPGVAEVPVGMIAYDKDWQWHDDGFKQVVATGKWTEISWELKEPGLYNQIGFKFPVGASTVYIGQVDITP